MVLGVVDQPRSPGAPAGVAASASPTNANTTSSSNKEDHIILPPPSATNPLPALGAALRLDQQEQLMDLLQQDPATLTNTSLASTPTTSSFQQLLVFANDRLRTLLLRQALTDPHERVYKNKKKNWDGAESFVWPKELQHAILGTKVLQPTKKMSTEVHTADTPRTDTASANTSNDPLAIADAFDETEWADVTEWAAQGRLDVVTYFLHAHTLEHTQAAIHRIQTSFRQSSSGGTASSSRMIHHRLVYLPQRTQLVQQLLQQSGLTSQPNVSCTSLQLDLFPLETDVMSTEYHDGLRDAVAVEMTPSHLITCTARSLLKLQDITGKIPRLQGYGPLAEEVLRKVLHLSVDEYLMGGGGTNGAANPQDDDEEDDDDQEDNEEEDQDSSRRQKQAATGSLPIPESGVAALILMDRRVDWVTPMVTPLTYEALLDELMGGVDAGFLHIPLSTINPPEDNEASSSQQASSPSDPLRKDDGKNKDNTDNADEPIALAVNGADSLFAEVRNQHVEQFGSFLQNQAMALRQSHAEFTAHGKSKDLTEIHQFVKQIPAFAQNLRSLTNHIHLAEWVKKSTEDVVFRERWQTERSLLEGETCYETLEDLVASQYPPFGFFRLLCLQSICAGGIKSSRLDALKRDVVQTYGYDFLFVLHNLEQAGLLRRREGLWMDSASSFSSLRKSLVLIHPEVNTVEPDDAAYVSSGYAPISVRLIQTAVKGWTGREEILRELPGRALDIFQTTPPQDLTAALQVTPTQPLGATVPVIVGGGGSSTKKPILAVLYIGGITFMEIAALRFLSQRPSFPYHILILTTEIVNGSTLLQSMK